jgi:2-phosphosulfolactate phosphatase
MSKKLTLNTLLSPILLDLYPVSTNSIVVIIDVFRATSTIATALYNGAEKIIPVSRVDECIAIGKKLNAVTAGERDGKIIEGLQHGNSPAEYYRENVGPYDN